MCRLLAIMKIIRLSVQYVPVVVLHAHLLSLVLLVILSILLRDRLVSKIVRSTS